MKRRRAKAVLRTELPLLASRIEEFEDRVKDTLALLPKSTDRALGRLALIARTYHDGRRLEAQKVARPDCRKSLEALADLASRTCKIVVRLPKDHRLQVGKIAQGELAIGRQPVLPHTIGRALEEVAQFDLRRSAPGIPEEMLLELDRFTLSATELAYCCAHLPMDAEWLLVELQQYAPIRPAESAEAEYLYALCENLRRHSWVASELKKFNRGPRSDTVQMRTVLALKGEFERTGEMASHNSKDETGYLGEATSPFGLFVHKFFAGIDPSNPHRRGLNNAIEFACWPSRSSGRQQEVLDEAKRRERQIIDLLKEAGVTNFSPDD